MPIELILELVCIICVSLIPVILVCIYVEEKKLQREKESGKHDDDGLQQKLIDSECLKFWDNSTADKRRLNKEHLKR